MKVLYPLMDYWRLLDGKTKLIAIIISLYVLLDVFLFIGITGLLGLKGFFIACIINFIILFLSTLCIIIDKYVS